MSCAAQLTIYKDLEGKPTGEFGFECAGPCPEGVECKKVVDRFGDDYQIYCACGGKHHEAAYEAGTCSLRFYVFPSADGRVGMRRQCSYRPCPHPTEAGCHVCRVTAFERGVQIVDLDKAVSRIRQFEKFRCECVAYKPTKRLVELYEKTICKLVSFALAHGSTLARDDLYHAHVVLDQLAPDGPSDDLDLRVVDDDYLVDHLRGLVGHAHESDGKRDRETDNFNIYVDAQGNVRFAGSTKPVDPQNRAGIPGVFEWTQIHFRFCDADKDCPPCTTKIHCPGVARDICVAWDRLWPDGDPALGG